VFHSQPFQQDVGIAGQMRLKLMVQSDTPDFDLWAQVLMVLPDGERLVWEKIFDVHAPQQPIQKGDAKAKSNRRDTVRILLDGMANSERLAIAPHCCSTQLSQLPEELQHWRQGWL
jgi:predicted acyl esterase